MKQQGRTRSIAAVLPAFFPFIAAAQIDFGYGLSYANPQLTNLRCIASERGEDTAVTCFVTFSQRPQRYSYDLYPLSNEIKFTFDNTTLGGFFHTDTIMTVGYGPVKSVQVQQQQSIDGAPGTMVVNLRLECIPSPRYKRDIEVNESGNSMSISMIWPGTKEKRNKLYFPAKEGHPFLAASLIGIGCLGAAAGGGYYYWKKHSYQY